MNKHFYIAAFIALCGAPTFNHAQDIPPQQSDVDIASQLTDCYNGLTALDGLSAAADIKIDRERLLNSKRIAKLGSFSLVGDVKAKELYATSKEKVKADLTTAIQEGPKGVATFVQRYTNLCSDVTDQHGSYIGGRIAAEKRIRAESAK